MIKCGNGWCRRLARRRRWLVLKGQIDAEEVVVAAASTLRLTYGGEGSGVLRCAVRASVLARENLSKELISPLTPARAAPPPRPLHHALATTPATP